MNVEIRPLSPDRKRIHNEIGGLFRARISAGRLRPFQPCNVYEFFGIPACTAGAALYDEPLLKMKQRETILLDALLEGVIEPHAFRAVLDNGHVFTAYVAARDRQNQLPEKGARVSVEMSPCNMSAGRIII